MSDPFDALRAPTVPVDPDHRFAARLRRRLTEAITPTHEEEPMTDTLERQGLSRNGTRHGDVSYISLGVADDASARAFYGSVLGWRYAEGRLESTGNQVDDVIPQIGLWAGPDRGPRARPGAVLSFRVDDIHSAAARVREAGGTAGDPVQRPYGLEAECGDGHGLVFWLHQLPRPGLPAPPNGERQGDISYVVLAVSDLDLAREFFGTVLGWRTSTGGGGGLQVEGTAPMIGLSRATTGEPGAVLCYRVDDIDAAVSRVRTAGGTSTDPVRRPYGLEAECTDNQATPFYLHGLGLD